MCRSSHGLLAAPQVSCERLDSSWRAKGADETFVLRVLAIPCHSYHLDSSSTLQLALMVDSSRPHISLQQFLSSAFSSFAFSRFPSRSWPISPRPQKPRSQPFAAPARFELQVTGKHGSSQRESRQRGLAVHRGAGRSTSRLSHIVRARSRWSPRQNVVHRRRQHNYTRSVCHRSPAANPSRALRQPNEQRPLSTGRGLS